MREILFRGKRKGCEDWVYGFLTIREFNALAIFVPSKKEKLEYAEPFGITYCVEPETVGQFTGLYDSTKWSSLTEAEQTEWLKEHTKSEWKGRKIFEGDIHERIVRGKSYLFVVKHGKYYDSEAADKRYGWYFQNTKTNDCNSFYGDEKDYANIIGNINDNPELLGGEAK